VQERGSVSAASLLPLFGTCQSVSKLLLLIRICGRVRRTPQSQRDCVSKPRVARHELPWGKRRKKQPQRGCDQRPKAETPLGFCLFDPLPQGSSFLATLIGVPKLFADGEESLWNLSPQPTVNNFARRAKDFCEQLPRAVRPALTPCWMTNTQPVSSDESAQSFAPARRLDSRRILRCGQSHVSAIRPSLSPSQRGRNSNSAQCQS